MIQNNCKICGKPLKYNYVKAHKDCLKGKNSHMYLVRAKKFAQYDLEGNLISRWKSQLEIQRVTEGKFKKGRLSLALNGKIKTYKNYIWKYET